MPQNITKSTYRCRKQDNINMSWEHDYNFFPNNTSFNIIYIMHFIKNNLLLQTFRNQRKTLTINPEMERAKIWNTNWNAKLKPH